MHTAKWMAAMAVFALVCVSSGAPVAVAAQCVPFKLDVADPATLSLQDGDYVIGAVDTERGKFEARVSVRGKVVSEHRFFLGGRLLRPTPESQVPPVIRACFQNAQFGAEPSGGWLATAARSIREWVEPTAEAVSGKCTVGGYCRDTSAAHGYCCAVANCSGSIGFHCVNY
jgi:hypothetical protein